MNRYRLSAALAIFFLICSLTIVAFTLSMVKRDVLNTTKIDAIGVDYSRLPNEFLNLVSALAHFGLNVEGYDAEFVEERFDIVWTRCEVILEGATIDINLEEIDEMRKIASSIFDVLQATEDQIFDLDNLEEGAYQALLSDFATLSKEVRRYNRIFYASSAKISSQVAANNSVTLRKVDYALIALGSGALLLVVMFLLGQRSARRATIMKAHEAEREKERARDLARRADEFERQTAVTTAELSQSVTSLSETAIELLGDAKTTESRCDEANAVSDRSEALARAMLQSARSMSDSLNAVVMTMRENADAARGGVAQVQKSAGAIGALDVASNEIEGFVREIRSIADKTRRVSINARIEAASAGDSGRAFSVVALEVDGLAEQAREASASIEERANSIRAAAGGAAATLREIGSVIEAVEKSSQTLAAAIADHDKAANEIANDAETAAESASRVRMDVGAMRSVAEATRTRSQEVERSSSELALKARKLETTISEILSGLARS